LLIRELIAHDVSNRYLADDELLLYQELLFEVFVLLDDSFECLSNLFASFDDLFPEEFVFNPCVFESLQHGVLLVDALNLSALHFFEHVG
jgi:hypothetical protein